MLCLALGVAPGLLAMTQQSWALVMVLLRLIAADVILAAQSRPPSATGSALRSPERPARPGGLEPGG
jgi:hypothetical protein